MTPRMPSAVLTCLLAVGLLTASSILAEPASAQEFSGLHPGDKEPSVDFDHLHSPGAIRPELRSKGITCSREDGKLTVLLGFDEGLFDFDPQDLQLLKQLGPIDRLVVEDQVELSSEDYEVIASSEGLKKLEIRRPLSDRLPGLFQTITQAQTLQSLSLMLLKVEPDELKQLDLKRIKQLNIVMTPTHAEHIQVIAENGESLVALCLIIFNDYQVTLEDLKRFRGNASLKHMTIHAPHLSPADRAEIQELMPNCKFCFDVSCVKNWTKLKVVD